MLKLGQVINPSIISVINKLATTSMNVDERVAFKQFVKVAEPASKEWQELLGNFRKQIDDKDSITLSDLDKQWKREIEAPKLPASLIKKLPEMSPNEENAFLEVCEEIN